MWPTWLTPVTIALRWHRCVTRTSRWTAGAVSARATTPAPAATPTPLWRRCNHCRPSRRCRTSLHTGLRRMSLEVLHLCRTLWEEWEWTWTIVTGMTTPSWAAWALTWECRPRWARRRCRWVRSARRTVEAGTRNRRRRSARTRRPAPATSRRRTASTLRSKNLRSTCHPTASDMTLTGVALAPHPPPGYTRPMQWCRPPSTGFMQTPFHLTVTTT